MAITKRSVDWRVFLGVLIALFVAGVVAFAILFAPALEPYPRTAPVEYRSCLSVPRDDFAQCTQQAREQSDLLAQWQSAVAAKNASAIASRLWYWSAFELLLLVLTLGAACYAVHEARRAANAAEDAIKHQEEQGRRQLRAYVVIEGIACSATRLPDATRNTIRFSINVIMRNCGQTPAKQVARWIEVYPTGEHSLSTLPGKRIGLAGSKRRLDIGPSQPFNHTYDFEVDFEPLAMDFDGQAGEGQPGVCIQGHVEYSDYSGDRWRVPYECTTGGFRTDQYMLPGGLYVGALEQAEEERVQAASEAVSTPK